MSIAGPVVGEGALLSGGLDIPKSGCDVAFAVAGTLRLGDRDGALQDVERLPRVSGGEAYKVVEGLLADGHAALGTEAAGQSACLVRQGPPDDRRHLFVGQRFQAVDPEARQQRRVHLEVRILRGGADEGDGPFLDMGQKRVLLSLVEAMDLVDEEDRLAAVESEPVASFRNQRAHFGDAAHDGRDRHEMGTHRIGQDAGQAGLAAARGPPEEDRSQAAALGDATQGSSFPDQLFVADDLVNVPGAHPGGQRLAARWRRKDRLLIRRTQPGDLASGSGRSSGGHVRMLQARRGSGSAAAPGHGRVGNRHGESGLPPKRPQRTDRRSRQRRGFPTVGWPGVRP